MNPHCPAGREPMLGHNWRIIAPRGRLEAVAKLRAHRCCCLLIQVYVDAPPVLDDQRAEVVDAVGMIGMRMGEEHSVKPIHLRRKQLLAQVRRRIHQHLGGARPIATLHQERSPAPAVLGVVRIAVPPSERRARHAPRRAAAENRKSQGHAATAARCGTLLKS